MRIAIAVLKGVGLGLVVAIAIGGIATWLELDRAKVGVDPSQKARVLAQSISETMNCSALAALILIPAFTTVMVRRSKKRG